MNQDCEQAAKPNYQESNLLRSFIMSSSDSEDIDFEGIPVLGVGTKRQLKITTYIELHSFIEQLVKILEEIFEMGILKGTAKRFDEPQVCPQKR